MITDHRFVGLRQWGIRPSDDKPCQYDGCGLPRNQHSVKCKGMLIIKGESFPCDMQAPHDGWGHANKDASAIWQ